MLPPPQEMVDSYAMLGMTLPDRVPVPFDFGLLKLHPMMLQVDVGASTYYSEIGSMQTMDNLLRLGAISRVQFFERVSDDYIPDRRGLIEEIKREEAEQKQLQMMQMGILPPGGAPPAAAPPAPIAPPVEEAPPLPTGGGYSALQRKINETGDTSGLI